ncbi:MAG: hypothetical protein ACHP7D_11015, partial [Lysobacterales bacterium]
LTEQSQIYLTQGGAFDSSLATDTSAVGNATLHFSDCMHGTLQYTFSDGSGRSGTIPLTRLLANVTCATAGDSGVANDYLYSGAWADPGNSGQGLVFDVNPPQNILFAAWYTFAPTANQGSGPAGQRWYTLQAPFPSGARSLSGIGIFETTGGVFDHAATTTTTPVGSANLVFHSCGSATLSYSFTGGANAGRSGSLDLTRAIAAPAGCHL